MNLIRSSILAMTLVILAPHSLSQSDALRKAALDWATVNVERCKTGHLENLPRVHRLLEQYQFKPEEIGTSVAVLRRWHRRYNRQPHYWRVAETKGIVGDMNQGVFIDDEFARYHELTSGENPVTLKEAGLTKAKDESLNRQFIIAQVKLYLRLIEKGRHDLIPATKAIIEGKHLTAKELGRTESELRSLFLSAGT